MGGSLSRSLRCEKKPQIETDQRSIFTALVFKFKSGGKRQRFCAMSCLAGHCFFERNLFKCLQMPMVPYAHDCLPVAKVALEMLMKFSYMNIKKQQSIQSGRESQPRRCIKSLSWPKLCSYFNEVTGGRLNLLNTWKTLSSRYCEHKKKKLFPQLFVCSFEILLSDVFFGLLCIFCLHIATSKKSLHTQGIPGLFWKMSTEKIQLLLTGL